jgi:hypothetical protein
MTITEADIAGPFHQYYPLVLAAAAALFAYWIFNKRPASLTGAIIATIIYWAPAGLLYRYFPAWAANIQNHFNTLFTDGGGSLIDYFLAIAGPGILLAIWMALINFALASNPLGNTPWAVARLRWAARERLEARKHVAENNLEK